MRLTIYAAAAPSAALVLAHGAGAGQHSPFMVRVATLLAERGIAAATFDFPYIAAGRRVPDRAPVLENAWRDAIDEARGEFAGRRLFIGGKSMGGRMASHVAAHGDVQGLSGLVFLGYPLHPPGKTQQRRDSHLPRVREPMLFVQGSRDAFGTAEEIRGLLSSMRAATLHEVPGGDHSFHVGGRGADQSAVLPAVADAVAAWIDGRPHR